MVDVYVRGLWSQLKFNLYFYLGVILVIMLLAWLGVLSFFVLTGLLLCAGWFRLVLFKEKRIAVYLKQSVVVVGLVSLFWFLPQWLGVWGLIVLLAGFVAYKFWRGRKVFMRSMRFVESKLFGRPLDRKEWKKKGDKPSIYKEEEEDGICKE